MGDVRATSDGSVSTFRRDVETDAAQLHVQCGTVGACGERSVPPTLPGIAHFGEPGTGNLSRKGKISERIMPVAKCKRLCMCVCVCERERERERERECVRACVLASFPFLLNTSHRSPRPPHASLFTKNKTKQNTQKSLEL